MGCFPTLVAVLAVQFLSCNSLPDVSEIMFKTNLDEPFQAPITFQKPLPSWLKGTLIRNGIGRFEVGQRKFDSAFDAYAKLASWTFPGNGSAYFSAKMVHSKSYNQSVAMNDIAPFTLLDNVTPPYSFAQKMEEFKNGPDNMNVNVWKFGDPKTQEEILVLSDYWNCYVLNQKTLSTLRETNPPVTNSSFFITLGTAHPLPEYGTTNSLTFASLASLIPGSKSYFKLMRATSTDKRELIAEIEVDQVSYMHSFAVTENYAILLAQPFFVNPLGMLKHFDPLDTFKWEPNEQTSVYVVNLKTKETATLKGPNMFFLHVCNAYETGDSKIVIDVSTFPDPNEMRQFTMAIVTTPSLRVNSTMATIKRYTLDLSSGDVMVNEFDNHSKFPFINHLDFPSINEQYRSKEYCYLYGAVYNYDGTDKLKSALVKKDVCKGTKDTAWFADNMYVNEALFLPNPNGTEEDDGILITPVLDMLTQRTNITIFDGKTLTPINSAMLPTNIPFGTHGHFFETAFL